MNSRERNEARTRKTGSDFIESEYRPAEAKLTDPVRCALCLAQLRVPRLADLEEYMIAKNQQCLHSKKESCQKAVKNPSNQKYIQRIQNVEVNNGRRTPR